MEYKKFTQDDLKFPIPSAICVSGPSSSGHFKYFFSGLKCIIGKTELVLKLIEHRNEMFKPVPKAVGRLQF